MHQIQWSAFDRRSVQKTNLFSLLLMTIILYMLVKLSKQNLTILVMFILADSVLI